MGYAAYFRKELIKQIESRARNDDEQWWTIYKTESEFNKLDDTMGVGPLDLEKFPLFRLDAYADDKDYGAVLSMREFRKKNKTHYLLVVQTEYYAPYVSGINQKSWREI
ncbi:MAG: hypothetical protein GPJ54_17075 [Candidatus Heimdallarchaeota archaeon]|nr:hypothetical protein [Candidatus Heimdallarchaeota archaeon]